MWRIYSPERAEIFPFCLMPTHFPGRSLAFDRFANLMASLVPQHCEQREWSQLRLCYMLSGFLFCCCAIAQQTSSQPPKVATTVVVLGNSEPVSQGESARSVVVLDTQQQPLAFQDVEDYLRTDTSVDIQQRGAAGVQADISIRGGSFEQTLVLLNGLRINDAETSHFNLDSPVPLEALGTIEVLHGAGSTLYGSDALAGVVDLITAKPEATALRLRTGVGSFGENQQAFVGSILGRKGSEVLAGSRDFSTGFIPDRDYRTEDGSSETRFDSSLGQTDILLAGSDRPFGASQFYGNYDSWERTKGWFASLGQQFNANTEAAVAYRRHSDIFVLLRDDPSVYKNQHIDESWEGAIRRGQPLFKDAKLYYGLEEDTDQIQSNSLGQHGRNRGAGYVDFDLRAAQRGTVSLGLRGRNTQWRPLCPESHAGGEPLAESISKTAGFAWLWLPPADLYGSLLQ